MGLSHLQKCLNRDALLYMYKYVYRGKCLKLETFFPDNSKA